MKGLGRVWRGGRQVDWRATRLGWRGLSLGTEGTAGVERVGEAEWENRVLLGLIPALHERKETEVLKKLVDVAQRPSEEVTSQFVQWFVKDGHVDYARKALLRMPATEPSISGWNGVVRRVMIAEERRTCGRIVLEEMLRAGTRPNETTFELLLRAYESKPNGKLSDQGVVSEKEEQRQAFVEDLLRLLALGDHRNEMWELWRTVERKGWSMPESCYSWLILGSDDQDDKTESIFSEMAKNGLTLQPVIFDHMPTMKSIQLLNKVQGWGLDNLEASRKYLLDLLYSRGESDAVHKLEIPTPSSAWTIKLCADLRSERVSKGGQFVTTALKHINNQGDLSRLLHECARHALDVGHELLLEVERAGLRVDPGSVQALVRATLDENRIEMGETLAQKWKHEISPAALFDPFIDAYYRNGCMEKAERVFNRLKEGKELPSERSIEVMYRILCSRGGKMEAVELVESHLRSGGKASMDLLDSLILGQVDEEHHKEIGNTLGNWTSSTAEEDTLKHSSRALLVFADISSSCSGNIPLDSIQARLGLSDVAPRLERFRQYPMHIRFASLAMAERLRQLYLEGHSSALTVLKPESDDTEDEVPLVTSTTVVP